MTLFTLIIFTMMHWAREHCFSQKMEIQTPLCPCSLGYNPLVGWCARVESHQV